MTCFGMIAAVSLETLFLPQPSPAPQDGSLASPLLNHTESLGLESEAECTLQCVYVLTCVLFHFYFVVMKSMLPNAEKVPLNSPPACGEEIIKFIAAIAPENTWTRRGMTVTLYHDRSTMSWCSSVLSLRFASATKNPGFFPFLKLHCQNYFYV